MDHFLGRNDEQVQCRGILHIVEAGDTLYKIGKKHGVPVSRIMYANPYVNVYNLQVGDEICVPIMVPRMPAGTNDMPGQTTPQQAAPMRGDRMEDNGTAAMRRDRMGDNEAPMRGDRMEDNEAVMRGDRMGADETAAMRRDRMGDSEIGMRNARMDTDETAMYRNRIGEEALEQRDRMDIDEVVMRRNRMREDEAMMRENRIGADETVIRGNRMDMDGRETQGQPDMEQGNAIPLPWKDTIVTDQMMEEYLQGVPR